VSTYLEKIVLDHLRPKSRLDSFHLDTIILGRSIQGSYSSRNQNDIIPCLGRGSKNENEKNLEILVCAKHAETEKHLTPKSIQPESILPPLIGHCQQLI